MVGRTSQSINGDGKINAMSDPDQRAFGQNLSLMDRGPTLYHTAPDWYSKTVQGLHPTGRVNAGASLYGASLRDQHGKTIDHRHVCIDKFATSN